ncbi:MAG: hypothetical protein Ta2G_14670 [Termitinemataceae bacterium]|nr:MAG: hypothetical protein Ta2G_14670 [Termitinemataceae bacterium]
MKYNTCVVGLVLAAFVGLSLLGCRPHSGVVDTGEEEGGGSSKETEADPKLVSITFDSGAVSLVPAFNPNVFIYAAQLSGVSLDDLTIIGETAEEKSIISYMANGQTIGFPAKGDVFVIKVDNSTHTKASTYVVQVANDADPRVLPSAEIDGVTSSVGTVTPPIGSGNTYTVELPHGTQRVALSAIVKTDAPYFVSYEPSNIVNNPTNDSEVIIHVIAAGMEQGTYKGVFHIADPIESFLSDINVTAGAVQNGSAVVLNFDPAVTTYSVNIPSSAASVIGVTGQANFLDSLSYTRNGTVCANGIVQNPANGDEIKIIVNGENDPKARSGYAEKIYTLNVQISPFVPAVLTDITENSGGSGTLYQGAGDSVTTTAGFSAGVTTYTFKSAPGYSGTVTFVGTHQSGNPSDVSYGGHAGGAVVNPKPSSAPLRIIAVGNNTSTLTNTYTIYFEYSFPPPPALLDSLTVFGGTGAKFKDTGGSATLTAPSAGNKVVQLTYGTPYIVLNHTADPTFNVTYTPSNFMSPPVHDSTIGVHVDGGNDWTAADYSIKIEVGAEQHPAFTELVIDETGFNPPVSLTSSLSNNVLFYRAQLLPTMTADNVVITWKVTNETINAKTSIDGGSSWQTSTIDGSHNGGYTIVGLASGDAQIVLVKLTTSDGSSAIYTLDVSRISDSGRKLSNLKVNGRQITLPGESAGSGPFTLTPSLADIGNPISTSITLVPIINAGYSIDYVIDDDATYSLVKTGNNASLGLPAGVAVEVTIIVSAGAITETYELHLFKPDSYYVSAGGSDSATGDRSTAPFLKLKDALDAAKATNGAVPKVTVIGSLTSTNSGLNGTTAGSTTDGTSGNSAFEIVNTGGIPITIEGSTSTANLTGSNTRRVVFIKNSKINFTNIHIKNGTIAQNGAGIYADDGSQITLGTGALVISNTAGTSTTAGTKDGGGVFVKNGGALTLNGGSITSNIAGGSTNFSGAYGGGGIFVDAGATFTMNSGIIENNKASSGSVGAGGGVFSMGTTTITGGTIGGSYGTSGNNQATDGGGVYVLRGVCTIGGGTSTAAIRGNNATSGGGGIVTNWKDSVKPTINLLANALISENRAGDYGGGIGLNNTDVTINGATISNNTSTKDGGGLRLGPNTTVTLSNGTISGNTANGYYNTSNASTGYGGGGIFIDAGATFTMSGGAIENNQATSGSAGAGGGVFSMGTITITGGTIGGDYGTSGNNRASHGGGIYLLRGVCTIGGGTSTAAIRGNHSTNGGGGIVTNWKDAVKPTIHLLANAQISENTADTYGGGIGLNNTDVTINGATISNNTATENGGGLRLGPNTTVTLSNGTINGNTSVLGGGVYVGDGTFTMNNGTISGNTSTTSNASLYNSGGGIYGAAGTLNLNGGTISGNTSSNSGSSDKASGGGVSSEGSTLKLAGVTISGNTAYYGGGVISKAAGATMTGGSITGNSSANLYIQNTAKAVEFIMSGGTISAPGSGANVRVLKGTFRHTGIPVADVTIANSADGADVP